MAPSTGYIKYFKLYSYDEGLVLQMPECSNTRSVPEFRPQHKLFTVMEETTRWGEMLGIETVGELNEAIAAGRGNELILVQEALQEKNLLI